MKNQGFTLVEMLVALTLLSAVFAFVSSGWLTMSSGQKRLEASVKSLMDTSTKRAIFANAVAQALPWIDRQDATSALIFEGLDDRLSFVATRPEFEIGSPFQFWRWRLQPSENGLELQVQTVSFRQGMTVPEPSNDWRSLLSLDDGSAFSYLVPDEDGVAWQRQWPDETELPLAIALISDPSPPLIAPIRHTMLALCASAVASEIDECR